MLSASKLWIFGFDLGAVQHREAERAEEVLDFPLDLRDGVESAGRDARGGNGEIEPFGVETFRKGSGSKLGFARVVRFFDRLFRGVDELAACGALFGRELAHVLAELGQHAFAAEHFDAHGFEFFLIWTRLYARERAVEKILHRGQIQAAGR